MHHYLKITKFVANFKKTSEFVQTKHSLCKAMVFNTMKNKYPNAATKFLQIQTFNFLVICRFTLIIIQN